jgi:hypothetical protein
MPAIRSRTPSLTPLFIWDYSRDRAPRKRAIGHFDIRDGTWVKRRLDPKRHLAQIAGGSPAWDAQTYMALGPDLKHLAAYTTDNRVFRIDRATFEAHRFAKDFGYGVQYYCEYRYWSVSDAKQGRLGL